MPVFILVWCEEASPTATTEKAKSRASFQPIFTNPSKIKREKGDKKREEVRLCLFGGVFLRCALQLHQIPQKTLFS